MNTISTVNTRPNIRINNNQPIRKDFVNKASAVSFGSARSDALMTLLDNTIDKLVQSNGINIVNRLRFHKVLNEAIPVLIRPENYMNAGRDSKVYRISNKYVAKIKRGFYKNDSINFFQPINMPNKQYAQLDAYYGEPVIRHGQIEILKNATPTKNNIFCGVRFRGDIEPKSTEMEKYEKEFIPKCSGIPQESFDELAFNLKKMNNMSSLGLKGRKYYVPDIINPNNILISDNKFKIVDKLDKVPVKNPNTLFTMLEPLLLRVSPYHNAKYNEDLIEPRKNILKKCLISAEKAELPIDSPLKWEFADWTLSDLLPSEDLITDVYKMRKNSAPLEERIDYINRATERIHKK